MGVPQWNGEFAATLPENLLAVFEARYRNRRGVLDAALELGVSCTFVRWAEMRLAQRWLRFQHEKMFEKALARSKLSTQGAAQ